MALVFSSSQKIVGSPEYQSWPGDGFSSSPDVLKARDIKPYLKGYELATSSPKKRFVRRSPVNDIPVGCIFLGFLPAGFGFDEVVGGDVLHYGQRNVSVYE